MDALTNAVMIEIVATGESYHTLKDWGLAIGNNNPVGEPELEEYYVDVPGADGFLDFTEFTTGRRIFKSRTIEMKMGGKKPRNDWDIWIADIRNLLHGRKIKIIFDNDPGFYYIGRAKIQDFDRDREIGTFTIYVKADPYKYNISDNTEDWLWDSFDFETGFIDEGKEITIKPGETKEYTIVPDLMPFVPEIYVSVLGTAGLKMIVNGESYTLAKGRNRFADIVVDEEDVLLTFSGSGTFIVKYRRGSL